MERVIPADFLRSGSPNQSFFMSRILLLGSDRSAGAFLPLVADPSAVTRIDRASGISGQDDAGLVIDLSADDSTDTNRIEYPEGAIVFTSVLTTTATAASALQGRPLLGIAFLPGVSDRSVLLEISAPLGAPDDLASRGAGLLREATGREVEIVEDRVALISARILSMVINEAAFALMEGVADPADIDTAMKLGTNYPAGPLAWADAIGADRIVAILEALQREYGEERYRPAVLLKQHARSGRPFHIKETV
jgi:hypothetical protein